MAPSTAASMLEAEGRRTAGTSGALGARAFAMERALGIPGALGARAFAMESALGALGARAVFFEGAPVLWRAGRLRRDSPSAPAGVADLARASSSSTSLVRVICSARGGGTVPSGNGGRTVGVSAGRRRRGAFELKGTGETAD